MSLRYLSLRYASAILDPMRKSQRFSEQLRRAVRKSEKSRYRIARETGIHESTLSRFLNQGFGLSMESIDRLCDCLGARLTVDPTEKSPSQPSKKGR